MKKLIVLFVCLISLNFYAQESQFNWLTDLNTAVKASKDQNKPILLFFTDTNSTESQKMNIELFKSQEFKAIADKAILLIADNSSENNIPKRLIIHYNKINQFSSFVTLDSTGKAISTPTTDFSTESLNSYISFLNSL
ncbi:thioredoxin family protein [Flavobacteriaceae bacterium 144Ye]|nr:thioredoxin family protein [Flavobacteriaceae bacterium 144Ye]